MHLVEQNPFPKCLLSALKPKLLEKHILKQGLLNFSAWNFENNGTKDQWPPTMEVNNKKKPTTDI